MTTGRPYPDEPEWGIDRESLLPGEYYVLAWAKPEGFLNQDLEGNSANYEFPVFEFRHRYELKGGTRMYLRAHLLGVMRRIRNYLTFHFKRRFPLQAKLVGSDLLLMAFMRSDGSNDVPGFGVTDHSPQEAYHQFEQGYAKVRALLEGVLLDSLEDKVIGSVGTAIWTEDPIDAYLGTWRVLELIANNHVSQLGAGSLGVLERHLSATEVRDLKHRWPILAKIKIALGELIPDADTGGLGKCKDLRDRIAHGGVEVKDYEQAERCLETLFPIAYRLAELRTGA